MPQVVGADHLRQAQKFKQLWSRLSQSRDLISVGAYVAGGDPETDLAIALQGRLVDFLRQGLDENVGMAQSRDQLGAIFTPPAGG
ncbi:Flagellum-specific ATP synthase [compost metagenome]